MKVARTQKYLGQSLLFGALFFVTSVSLVGFMAIQSGALR